MKRVLTTFLAVIICACYYSGLAQTNDPVLLTVSGEKVTKSEFLAVYMKNNIKGDSMDRKSLEEYLELYINFKLKVKEAEEMGLDTVSSFKNELAGYRKQLAQPYLSDKEVDEALLKEAFEREKYDIRASHILVKVDKNSAPDDTLKAYKKIMDLRTRIMNGEAFEAVAKEASEDPSARDRDDPSSKSNVKGNGGDLGYFTVLDMIYPFENGAYNTPVGQVSMPVRTDYGYHLIKVTDRKPAMGKVTVAHVFISVPKDTKPEDMQKYKDKIDEAYTKLKNGEKWEDVVTKYSDDKGSAAKGGQLPPFGVNRMVPEFIVAIARLKNPGEYSEPVQTIYGWHIIKLIDKKGPQSFDDEKATLKNRMTRDSRANRSKDAVLARIKKEYNYREIPGVVGDFYTAVDTSIFYGNWDIKTSTTLTKPMFTLGDKTFTQSDFAKYLSTHQPKRSKTAIPNYVNEKYNQYIDETCLNYEDCRLEYKYPDFKSLMKEYRDGIMLFELTDEKVWSKAIKDTAGLETFYQQNKNNYMWEERLDASIYTCKNESIADDARKLAKVQEKKKLTDQDILSKINTDTIVKLKINSKLFLHKENSLIDNIPWVKGITDNKKIDNDIVFVSVHQLVAPMPKTIKEAKGIITADYQNYLEKQWVVDLRKKYTVDVNKPVFETLIKK